MKSTAVLLRLFAFFALVLETSGGIGFSDTLTGHRTAEIKIEGGDIVLAPSEPIENPPPTADKRPSAQDFNALLRAFLECPAIDITKSDVDAKVLELFSKETSNGLYRRLKLREREFGGAILVTPALIRAAHEQVISVAARIVYHEERYLTLQSKLIYLVFNEDGTFKRIFMPVGTKQHYKG